jgi:ribose transport system permease protein
LIVTTMQIAGLPPGTQDVIQGLVIIVVLALAGGLSLRRKGKAAQTSTDVGASPTTGRGGQPPEEGQPLERV